MKPRRVNYTSNDPQRPGLGLCHVRMTEHSPSRITIQRVRVSVTGHTYSIERVEVTKASPKTYCKVKLLFESLL